MALFYILATTLQIVHSLYSEDGAAVEPIREVFPSAVKEQGAPLSSCMVDYATSCDLP